MIRGFDECAATPKPAPRHPASDLWLLPAAFALLISPAPAQVLEEVAVVQGGGRFGEQPHVDGDLLCWPMWNPGVIECISIAHWGGARFGVAPYPPLTGVHLGGGFLFRGANGSSPDGLRIFAIPLSILDEPYSERRKKEILVSPVGHVVATNDTFVFIRVGFFEETPWRGKILAKPLDRLADLSPEAFSVVCELQDDRRTGGLGRTEAASSAFFVWADRESSTRTWKVHVKRTEDLFNDHVAQRVIDTRDADSKGVYVDLDGSLLVYQGWETEDKQGRRGIYFLDLDGDDEQVLLTYTTNPTDLAPTWPAISQHYVVWVEWPDYFVRSAWGRRLVDGRPVGENFRIGSGGSWITLDRNIAAWNGSTSVQEGDVVHQAIVVAELDLPGADDVGDVNHDGAINITDPLFVINYLFLGGPRPRLRLADADLDREITLSDAVVILEYLFLGGRRPGTPRS